MVMSFVRVLFLNSHSVGGEANESKWKSNLYEGQLSGSHPSD